MACRIFDYLFKTVTIITIIVLIIIIIIIIIIVAVLVLVFVFVFFLFLFFLMKVLQKSHIVHYACSSESTNIKRKIILATDQLNAKILFL